LGQRRKRPLQQMASVVADDHEYRLGRVWHEGTAMNAGFWLLWAGTTSRHETATSILLDAWAVWHGRVVPGAGSTVTAFAVSQIRVGRIR
jgi:hypothetical protein